MSKSKKGSVSGLEAQTEAVGSHGAYPETGDGVSAASNGSKSAPSMLREGLQRLWSLARVGELKADVARSVLSSLKSGDELWLAP